MPEETTNNRSDHDLLITVNTKLNRVIDDIKDLKDNTTQRVLALEAEKLNKEEALRIKKENDDAHLDYELRLRRLELWGGMAIGALSLFEIITRFFK